jgi:hypothetical protein
MNYQQSQQALKDLFERIKQAQTLWFRTVGKGGSSFWKERSAALFDLTKLPATYDEPFGKDLALHTLVNSSEVRGLLLRDLEERLLVLRTWCGEFEKLVTSLKEDAALD